MVEAVPALTVWNTEVVKDQNKIILQKWSRTAVLEQQELF